MASSTGPTKSVSSAAANRADPDPGIQEARVWQTLHAAVRRSPVDAAVQDLYAQLDHEVTRRRPTCWLSGRCCSFEQFEHRLYVTALEIAWVWWRVQSGPPALAGPAPTGAVDGKPCGPCVFQVDRLCSIHAVRPMGCRVFYCQEGTQQWQHELYECFLARLRQVHEEFSLPYRYLEWRTGLDQARRHGGSIDAHRDTDPATR